MTLVGVNKVVSMRKRPTEFFNRLPIYSSGQVFNYDMPVEFIMEGHNQIVFGNIPSIYDMPQDSVVGCVQLGWEADEEDSTLWKKLVPGNQFHIVRTYILDNPIKCSPTDFQTLSADDLLKLTPFHLPTKLNGVMALKYTFAVRVSNETFETVNLMQELKLDLTPEVKCEALDENGNIRDFKFLSLSCGNKVKRFEFKAEIQTELDRNAEPRLYNSVFEPYGKRTRLQIVFECKTQILW